MINSAFQYSPTILKALALSRLVSRREVSLVYVRKISMFYPYYGHPSLHYLGDI